ncbi:MAG: hypothetical protein EB153_09735, partial [Nitrosopumilaceae archaeon]|nr:hypothetical protein [Nitrosopumilaceae archaeon]
MSHTNYVGVHDYTCDAISGAYSQSVNLAPGESVNLHWKCEIFNPGTYVFTILDKTFTYTVMSKTNDSSVSDEQKQDVQQQESYNKEIQTTQSTQNSQQTVHQGEVVGQPHIVVLKVYTQPRKDIKAGGAIDISAQIKNLGEYRGSKKIDGTLTWYSTGIGKSLTLSSKTVTLDPQEETFLDWKGISIQNLGSYDITIGEGGVQFTVKEMKKKSNS